ncbi:MAG: hypothetical protein NTZ59_15215 [Bacteroidetes bacterium]|nr:hypothetical protein [Bacteroidota bacterium]
MKKVTKTIIILITVLNTVNLFSQDIITKLNGEEIKAKVLEVNQTTIKYKKFEFITGPDYTISKSEVFMIKYENGTKDIFKIDQQPTDINSTTPNTTTFDMRTRGMNDARVYYKGKNSGATTIGIGTVIISPLLGLVPAILTASSTPDYKNLNFNNSELIKNKEYYAGYIDEAHSIKKRKIWTSYGIGAAASIVLVLLFGSKK